MIDLFKNIWPFEEVPKNKPHLTYYLPIRLFGGFIELWPKQGINRDLLSVDSITIYHINFKSWADWWRIKSVFSMINSARKSNKLKR